MANTLSVKRRLLRRWDYLCVICGRPFANMACVTKEHLIPRSLGGSAIHQNVGPSHGTCNDLRGALSILRAAALVDSKYAYMVSTIGEGRALQWLNKPVPGNPHRFASFVSGGVILPSARVPSL